MNLLEDKNNQLWESKNVIYCYTNKINGKKYVGQTKMTLKERHKSHLNQNGCPHFHKAIKKHGIQNFTLEILHFADDYSLDLLERYYIDKWKLLSKYGNGYNLSNGGSNGNPFAGKTEEEMDEFKRRVSESHIGIQSGENHPMYGKHHNKESKNKMSKTRIEK